MDPILNKNVFRPLINEFDKKTNLVDANIQKIKRSIEKNPECLLVLDKHLLSRLKVKLINGGISCNDATILRIEDIISTWRTDLSDLFKETSKTLDILLTIKQLDQNSQLVIYRHRAGGDYEAKVESKIAGDFSKLPWEFLSATALSISHEKYTSLADMMNILQIMQTKGIHLINKLADELTEENVSNKDFETGLNLLVSMHSCLLDAIKGLDFLKTEKNSKYLVEDEQFQLGQFGVFLGKKIVELNELSLKKASIAPNVLQPKEKPKGDIVCEYSQGRLTDVRREIGIENKDDDNQGSLACAVICMKALQSYFDTGLPKSEKEIYHLIDKGVEKYKHDGFDGLVAFEDVQNTLTQEEQNKMKLVMLTTEDGIDDLAALSFEMTGELASQVSIYLDSILDAVLKKAKETDHRLAAVLTTQSKRATNATLVIMFDENKKPALFNSHGETYQGESKGASLIKFENMNDLKAYIKKTFFKNEDGQFQIRLLTSTLF